MKRKRIRRGGGGGGAATTSLTILSNNVCGWNCKKASIPALLEKLKPDVCAWQETGLTGNNVIKLKGYHCSLRNRKTLKKMGGVCTAVDNRLKSKMVTVKEGENEDEYLITRLEHVKPALNIVNIYGGQESRMEKQEILESWGRLKKDLDEIKARNESCLLTGDFNRAIGADEFGVKNNNPRISYGGQLVRELLEEGEYILANNSDLAVDGPWTWVCRGNGKVRSCLDLVIFSADLLPYFKSLLIDTKHQYSPARSKMKDGKMRLIHPDHFPLIVKLENMPTQRVKVAKTSNWKFNTPGGWEKYESMSNEISDKMDNITENKSLNIEEVQKKTDALQTKIMFKSFGKSKPMTVRANRRRLEDDAKSALRLVDDEVKAKELRQKQSEIIEEQINKIKEQGYGRVANVFKMREEIAGPKKQPQEPHAVKDPKTGKNVVSTEEIKRVNLEHCVNVLKNNKPKPEVEDLLKFESALHDLMMEDKTDYETNISEDDFKKVVGKFKKKNKKSYYLLIRSGQDFQRSIFKLCKRMIEEESFPSVFNLTILHQLWKRKKSKCDLNNHRYLHMKHWLPRLTEALTVDLMKEDIISSGNKFQIGGLPGHRVEEHLIVVKSLIQLYIYKKLGVIMQLVDIEKFFDLEILRTVMTTLNYANVNKKAYRCWFKLNSKTVISVATPAGLTKTAEAYEVVPQGSGGAALASGADVARGLDSYFRGSMDEISYGSVRLQPLAYQDDVCRLAGSLNTTRAGNTKLAGMMDTKGLKCHPDKTVCIVIGDTKWRRKIEQEIETNPIMFGSFKVKSVKEDVYLGEVISAQGLEAGLEATIRRRLGKVRGAMHETKAIMSDFQMQAMGGMAGAWDIWERAILPSLLSNCGSWMGMTKKIKNLLNEQQNMFLRMIYSCPPSTPLLALRTQAGMLDMEHRVWVEKVCLVVRLLHTQEEQENLCRELLQEQLAQGWPGLVAEVQEICSTVGLSDATKQYINRKTVVDSVEYYSMKMAKEEMAGKEKYRHIISQDFRKMQNYMLNKSLFYSKIEFLWQTDMLETRTTMKGKYTKNQYWCPHCELGRSIGILETPSHLLQCKAYCDLRQGIDPELVVADRAPFLAKVVIRRKELEEQLRSRSKKQKEQEQ